MKLSLIALFVILLCILTYCLIKLNNQSDVIKMQNVKIKYLSPKFNGEDTLSLLNLVLNLKEFDDNSKLLDTSKNIMILMYPYISKEYILYKYNKKVWFYTVGDHPYQNQFMFGGFKFYNTDSARIDFIFNVNQLGILEAKKIKGNWNVKNYIIGTI